MHEAASVIEQALSQLAALHPKKIDLGLERIERVLKILGDPHLNLPPVIHVAGTNGKGSTVAFLRAFAEAQGLTCHVYTSPHLVTFHERIVIGSRQIDDATLIDVLDRIKIANDGAPLSFFEATTAAAFLAFSEAPADLCLLEVGLGGRFDATNVIDKPALCAITPIALDHAEFLGRDVAGIAREKAGIFKWHAPAYIAPQTELVSAVLESEANKLNVQAKYWGQDFRTYTQNGRLVFEDDNQVMDLPLPNLIGAHQIRNAGLAIALAKHLEISSQAIEKGLQQVKWPARLQHLTQGPLVKKVERYNGELWLDGGHNPHAAIAVASSMADMEAKHSRPLVLITGMLANKDIGGFLDSYAGLATSLVSVTIPGHTAIAPETLTELAKSRGLSSSVADDLNDAIDQVMTAYKDANISPRILICGSLYLAGIVLKENG